MNDSSRTQGGLICVAVVILAAWFVSGLMQGSYWAIALPVAVIVFFVLGLSFWVGYTIATIRVEPFEEPADDATPEPPATSPSATAATNGAGEESSA